MVGSIELQVISKILISQEVNDDYVIDELCKFDASYYALKSAEISYILDHRDKYGNVPDRYTFLSKYPDFALVDVREGVDYLKDNLKRNKKHIIFMQTINTVLDMGSDDINEAWEYIGNQYESAMMLTANAPMDIISEADVRAAQVAEWAKQKRIPTGFAELDKLTYGGWSTVEEVAVVVARSNNGKSWFCAQAMEAAHKAGFPVAYYSPEMQASYLATRFDTWRAHFKNSDLFQGKYNEEYNTYINRLKADPTPAFIIEDKDMPDGVSPRHLDAFVRQNNIKLLIVDGISYMVDDRKSFSDHEKYAHICHDLFQISKKYGCAIILAVQANRETKESKDEKGIPFPDIYNIAGSDAIGQIATQVYALRQIFDKHVFEIRMEKSRMAANSKVVLSYSWDVNTGNKQYLPGGADEDPTISMPDTSDILTPSEGPVPEDLKGIIDLDSADAEELDW